MDRYNYISIATWYLKGGIVKPEETVVAIQRLFKHVYAERDTNAAVEEMLVPVYSMSSMQSLYSEDRRELLASLPRGGRIEYLHRSPVSRRRRQKQNQVPGNITGSSCPWGIWIRGSGPPHLGNLESETVKYVKESRGSRTWEWLRWRGLADIINDRPSLSSERMLHKDYNCKIWVGKQNYWS
jgi:hypothetical protein